jgi:very-short-patch-repair endonuclease
VLAAGPGAALSHRSAGALWGMRSWNGRDDDVTSSVRRHPRPGLRLWCSPLPNDEVHMREGIPVTTPARTLLDLAAVLEHHQLEHAVAEAEYRRLGDPVSLADLLERYPGRRGSASLRTILADRSFGGRLTRSELEERFLMFAERYRLPRPAVNVWLHGVEADFVWHEQRLIAELDGYAGHGTRRAFERDRRRDRALTAAGWRVVRVTWLQLHREDRALADDLGRLLTKRSA